jgi:hypothetical protein
MTAQGPQRRPVFDPLVDGVMARKAGKSDAEIMGMMQEAGLTRAAPRDIVDQVLDVALSAEGQAWKAMSPKERAEASFAARGQVKPRQQKSSRPRDELADASAEVERLEAEQAAWDEEYLVDLDDPDAVANSIWADPDEPDEGEAA